MVSLKQCHVTVPHEQHAWDEHRPTDLDRKYYFCSGIEDPVHTDEPKPGKLKIEMPIVEVSPELERVLFGERDPDPKSTIVLGEHRYAVRHLDIVRTVLRDENGKTIYRYDFRNMEMLCGPHDEEGNHIAE